MPAMILACCTIDPLGSIVQSDAIHQKWSQTHYSGGAIAASIRPWWCKSEVAPSGVKHTEVTQWLCTSC